jgi:hypothetical protein
MSFDIFIQDMGQHVSQKTWVAARDSVMRDLKVQSLGDGHNLILPGGEELEFFDSKQHAGGMAALQDLTVPVCELLFELTKRADLFLIPAVENARAVRAARSLRPVFPDSSLKELPVEDGLELHAFLSGGFEVWSEYRSKIKTDQSVE